MTLKQVSRAESAACHSRLAGVAEKMLSYHHSFPGGEWEPVLTALGELDPRHGLCNHALRRAAAAIAALVGAHDGHISLLTEDGWMAVAAGIGPSEALEGQLVVYSFESPTHAVEEPLLPAEDSAANALAPYSLRGQVHEHIRNGDRVVGALVVDLDGGTQDGSAHQVARVALVAELLGLVLFPRRISDEIDTLIDDPQGNPHLDAMPWDTDLPAISVENVAEETLGQEPAARSTQAATAWRIQDGEELSSLPHLRTAQTTNSSEVLGRQTARLHRSLHHDTKLILTNSAADTTHEPAADYGLLAGRLNRWLQRPPGAVRGDARAVVAFGVQGEPDAAERLDPLRIARSIDVHRRAGDAVIGLVEDRVLVGMAGVDLASIRKGVSRVAAACSRDAGTSNCLRSFVVPVSPSAMSASELLRAAVDGLNRTHSASHQPGDRPDGGLDARHAASAKRLFDGWLTVDEALQVQTWNLDAQGLLQADEVMKPGTHLGSVLLGTSSEELAEIFSRARDARTKTRHRLGVSTALGTPLDLLLCIEPRLDSRLFDVGLIDLNTLHSSLTPTAADRRSATGADAMASLGPLIGGVAHDFNNHLTIILGYAEMLEMGLPEEHPLAADVAAVLRAGRSAAHLTRQLLAVGRKHVVAPVSLCVNEVVQELCSMLGRLLGDDITLSTDFSGGPMAVDLLPGHLDQVLINLVVNARDALPKGGDVCIRTSRQVEPAKDDTTPARAFACIQVQDNGQGMPEAVQKRIFEPFFSTKGPVQGTGLGLANIRAMVTQAGGSIAVESAPGEGTRFDILLPLVQDATSYRNAVKSPPHRPPQRPFRVLIVDDDGDVRSVAAESLRRIGYVVHTANGASAAESLCASGLELDVVVTDVVMPEVSGIELGERLRTLRPELLVLHLTGYTDDRTSAFGLDPSRHLVIAKPVTGQELANHIQKLVSEREGPC